MYEDQTYITILDRAMSRVPTNVDKRQGSIIFDALAPACAELAKMYIELDNVLNIVFLDTTYDGFLDRKGSEYGIYRVLASPATRLGLFYDGNSIFIDVPLGSRFSIDNINYVATEKISQGNYKMVCETSGVIGNQYFGDLSPIQEILSLAKGTLADVLIPGKETESDEDYRAEIIKYIQSRPFAGNRASYTQWFLDYQGVGACRIERAWNGGGTVKVYFLDSLYNLPTDAFVAQMQTYIDPTVNGGDGVGQAPFYHVVTVAKADVVKVDIVADITPINGYLLSDLQSSIEDAIDAYFIEIKKKYIDLAPPLVVQIAYLETYILPIVGVADIQNTSLNGVKGNLVLGQYEIPYKNSVILNTNSI